MVVGSDDSDHDSDRSQLLLPPSAAMVYNAVRQPTRFTTCYTLWLLALLVLARIVSKMDADVLAMFAPAIKKELSMSDGQLGFVLGTAYGVTTILTSPMWGRVADDSNRRFTLLAMAIVFFSVTTAAHGLAHSLLVLCAMRVSASFAEAAAMPFALSLLSDLYPLGQGRSLVLGCFQAGIDLGRAISAAWAGIASDTLGGWRPAIVLISCPGFVLALLIYIATREPPREGITSHAAAADAEPDHAASGKPSLMQSLQPLFNSRGYLWFWVGAFMHVAAVSATGPFMPLLFSEQAVRTTPRLSTRSHIHAHTQTPRTRPGPRTARKPLDSTLC